MGSPVDAWLNLFFNDEVLGLTQSERKLLVTFELQNPSVPVVAPPAGTAYVDHLLADFRFDVDVLGIRCPFFERERFVQTDVAHLRTVLESLHALGCDVV